MVTPSAIHHGVAKYSEVLFQSMSPSWPVAPCRLTVPNSRAEGMAWRSGSEDKSLRLLFSRCRWWTMINHDDYEHQPSPLEQPVQNWAPKSVCKNSDSIFQNCIMNWPSAIDPDELWSPPKLWAVCKGEEPGCLSAAQLLQQFHKLGKSCRSTRLRMTRITRCPNRCPFLLVIADPFAHERCGHGGASPSRSSSQGKITSTYVNRVLNSLLQIVGSEGSLFGVLFISLLLHIVLQG